MPRSNGIYTLPPVYQAEPGTTIRAEQHNAPLEDIASSMTNSLPRDGQAPMLSNLPMGGNRITNLGAGTNGSDAARLDQLPATSDWLEAVAALTMEPDRIPYATGTSTAALTEITAFARSFMADASSQEGRETLGFTIQNAPLAILNSTVAHDTAAWIAGTATLPGMPTPAQVRAAVDARIPTPPTAAGAVGTYALLRHEGSGDVTFGASVNGANLRVSNAGGSTAGSAPDGVWRCMGYISGTAGASRTTLFLRIS